MARKYEIKSYYTFAKVHDLCFPLFWIYSNPLISMMLKSKLTVPSIVETIEACVTETGRKQDPSLQLDLPEQ